MLENAINNQNIQFKELQDLGIKMSRDDFNSGIMNILEELPLQFPRVNMPSLEDMQSIFINNYQNCEYRLKYLLQTSYNSYEKTRNDDVTKDADIKTVLDKEADKIINVIASLPIGAGSDIYDEMIINSANDIMSRIPGSEELDIRAMLINIIKSNLTKASNSFAEKYGRKTKETLSKSNETFISESKGEVVQEVNEESIPTTNPFDEEPMPISELIAKERQGMQTDEILNYNQSDIPEPQFIPTDDIFGDAPKSL